MAQTFNSRLPDVAAHYVRLLGIKVTQTTLKRDLVENPYYPSLLSLSDTFDRYGLSNAAYALEGNLLDQAEPPFVAYASVKGNLRDFVLVTAISGDAVTYRYDGRKPVTLDREAFLKIYRGYIWVAESTTRVVEKDFEQKRVEERRGRLKRGVALVVAAAVLLGLAYDSLPSGAYEETVFCLWLLTKTAGMAVSVLLLLYESGSGGAFVQQICQAGAQTDCGAVLGSKASAIGGVTWSEIGFFYFAATLSGLLFPGVAFVAKEWLLCWSAFLVVLYTPFSLYYQWKVVRQWCPLCLCVQAILVLELTLSLIVYGKAASIPQASVLPAVMVCALWPALTWIFLKPQLTMARNGREYQAAYKRLRSNPDLFQGLLQQQAQAPDGWQELGIALGNPQAPIQILKVCSPYCGPCAAAHPVLEDVLERNKNTQLRILFTAPNKEGDRRTPVVKHLMALAARRQPGLIERALGDWYGAKEKDYKAFADKYPLEPAEGNEGEQLEAMAGWCELAEITFTPTIFVGGYRLPEDFSVQDLSEIL
ncbi:MAG TPA: vitamin K epoxide reductase family protein [Dinghuibacter sp.]|uniref:vitamin K epoxide reductase family protein n=1 Tax=Dinghuibacter sp. TaxID=2024697 RepID=UPI002C137145|nr:vitamin K epoxide reductase family protein [Dinghuibacter sp.]HTJ12441.1 vitamin K epoxide reductase family protein [Dinghuibacter sp.]